MLAVRLYYRCGLCKKVTYLDNTNPSPIKYKYCENCRFVARRAKSMMYRLGENVDILYVSKLLSESRCTYCGRELKIDEKQIEHKTPVVRGGGNENNNLCLSCEDCNIDKGSMTYSEYMDYKKLNPYMPGRYHRRMVLKMLSGCKLYEDYRVIKTVEKKVEVLLPKVKHVAIRGENGVLRGFKKEISYCETEVYYKTVKEQVESTQRKLTKYGEIYNTICRLANKPLIKTQ